MLTQHEMITYDAIPQAAWTMLSNAANDPRQRLRLFVAATITPDGRPSTRMLVLRGADRSSGLIWFHSDRRSPKVRHLKQRPYISALGYDDREHVQIRLDGVVTLHHDDALAHRHWQQTSMAVRHAYSLPEAPSMPRVQPDPRFQVMCTQRDLKQVERGRQNFVVIQVRVETIDWLQISPEGQIRAILRASNDWKAEPLTP